MRSKMMNDYIKSQGLLFRLLLAWHSFWASVEARRHAKKREQ